MRGPRILASNLRDTGAANAINADRRAQFACWTILFDLLSCSDAVLRDAAAGRLRVRVNEPLIGTVPETIDVAVMRSSTSAIASRQRTFATLACEWGVARDTKDAALLARLPPIAVEPAASPPAEVVVALTADDCIASRTDLAQLHARTLARGWLLKRHHPRCVTAALVAIAGDEEAATQRVIKMLAEALPREPETRCIGHDAIGATIVGVDAPWRRELQAGYLHYEQMVSRLCGAYRTHNPV